jgi:hypothetical protein
MDNRRFDEVTRTVGRRGVAAAVAGLVGSVLAGGDGLAGGVPLCAKRGVGERCRQNSQCCSRDCNEEAREAQGTMPLQHAA